MKRTSSLRLVAEKFFIERIYNNLAYVTMHRISTLIFFCIEEWR